MKKTLSILLVFLLLLTLCVGCGTKTTEPAPTADNAPAEAPGDRSFDQDAHKPVLCHERRIL